MTVSLVPTPAETPSAAGPAIRVIGLTKSYRSGDGALVVFENLNFQIEPGEKLALVGESGTGKSTLLHLLGGLDRPTKGEIYYGQHDICQLAQNDLAEFRNRELGFVWQIHSLLAEFTALENVMMPLLIRGQRREQAERVSMARLAEVGLRGRTTHRAGELSGGEQQRVVLARALAGDPSVLLADEPTGSLDEKTGGMIMDLLDDLHRSRRSTARPLTSIHVTHNLNFARRADRVVTLSRGQIAPAELATATTPNLDPVMSEPSRAAQASKHLGIDSLQPGRLQAGRLEVDSGGVVEIKAETKAEGRNHV